MRPVHQDGIERSQTRHHSEGKGEVGQGTGKAAKAPDRHALLGTKENCRE